MVQSIRGQYPNTNLQLMHCVSAYPCPLSDANTQRISLLHQAFGLPVGYSDHTSGDASAAMALVQGASFFEKHFTIDRSLPGFDHAHALDGPALVAYVRTINDAAASLARPVNSSSEREKITKLRARRGIYAARNLPAGHVLTEHDLLYVRPSSASQFTGFAELVGRTLDRDVARHTALGLGEAVTAIHSNWQQALEYWEREMKEKGMISGIRVSKDKS